MGLPPNPVTLSVEQINDLNQKLADMRHDINNQLSLIVAAAELIKLNPDLAKRMCATLAEQPPKISDCMTKFSRAFQTAVGMSPDS